MTTGAAVALAVAGLAAVIDWYSVARRSVAGVGLAKPLVPMALVVAAVLADGQDAAVRSFVVVGLVFSLMGDVFLELDDRFFPAGLVSFLVTHVNYTIAALVAGQGAWALVGVAVVVVGAVLVARRVAAAAGSLRAPVWCYVVAISAMVVASWGTAAVLLVAGAMLFYVSDGVLGWNRFVAPVPHGRLAVHVTYHLGQAGIVVWLAT